MTPWYARTVGRLSEAVKIAPTVIFAGLLGGSVLGGILWVSACLSGDYEVPLWFRRAVVGGFAVIFVIYLIGMMIVKSWRDEEPSR